MAKLPPEDRFRVTCNNIGVHELGPVMSALSKLNVNDVSFDLVTDIKVFNRRVAHEVKAEEFLQEWIKDNPTFKAKEAVTHFALHGRTAGSAYTALRILTEKRVLKKLSEGNYARSDVRQLPAPKKKARASGNAKSKPKPKPKHDSGQRYKTSNSDLLVKWATEKNGGKLDRIAAKKQLERSGRNGTSISSVIRDLLKASRIERVSEGEYAVLKSPTTNGGATHA